MANPKLNSALSGLMDIPTPVTKAQEGKPLKTFPFFTIQRKPGGWSFIEARLAPDMKTVVDVEESMPDMKAVAIERFKIAAAKYWTVEAEQ